MSNNGISNPSTIGQVHFSMFMNGVRADETIADTSGATLGNLEIEVNKVKRKLREGSLLQS